MVTADIAAPCACPLPPTPSPSEDNVGQQVIDMFALRQIEALSYQHAGLSASLRLQDDRR
jgi:hypothetical protein